MQFPFVLRSYHEAEVTRLKEQLVALAKLLYPAKDYPDGVPVEFQMLLGVFIPRPERPTAIEEREEAPQPVEDEEAQEREEDRRRLTSLARTKPSLVGPAMEEIMRRRIVRQVKNANPSGAVFAQAHAEALKQKSN